MRTRFAQTEKVELALNSFNGKDNYFNDLVPGLYERNINFLTVEKTYEEVEDEIEYESIIHTL